MAENQRQRYRDYTLLFIPKPIPDRRHDWDFWHDDYDGAEDAHDPRCGTAASPDECRSEIDEIEGN